MKTLLRLLIVCMAGCVTIPADAQNRYWVMPPNYVDFYTGQVLALPNTAISPATTVVFNDLIAGSTTTLSGAPLNKNTDYTYLGYRASNGVFNDDGDLQYYLNNKMYATMGRSVLYTAQYKDELLTIPVPDKCDYYYLITGTGSGSGNSYLFYKEISLDGSMISNKTLILPNNSGASLGLFRFALTPMTYNSINNEPEMKLYAASPGNPSLLYEIIVKEDGLHYIQSFPTDVLSGDQFYLEMEVSLDGRWVAWTSPGASGQAIFVYDLVNSVSYKYQLPTCSPMGIEFSPSSEGIFFTYWTNNSWGCSSSLNKVGYFNLSAGVRTVNPSQYNTLAVLSENDVQLMPGTTSLVSSFIEYAVDGLMYISDGTYLRGFDPLNFTNGFVKSYSIPNPVSEANTGPGTTHSYYTLVDQIDGADHTRLFQIGCETSRTISNVTSADGSLEAIAKVSQQIETASTVTVVPATSVTFKAGDQILLKPGFTVQAGGNFRGRLEACEDFVTDYCSGGARIAGPKSIEKAESFIHVYPNTTKGPVNITAGKEIRLLQVDIVTADGKPVLTRKFKGEQEAVLDLSSMSTGVYIVQIRHEKGLEVRRIVLIR